jgi:hypothetical protein
MTEKELGSPVDRALADNCSYTRRGSTRTTPTGVAQAEKERAAAMSTPICAPIEFVRKLETFCTVASAVFLIGFANNTKVPNYFSAKRAVGVLKNVPKFIQNLLEAPVASTRRL